MGETHCYVGASAHSWNDIYRAYRQELCMLTFLINGLNQFMMDVNIVGRLLTEPKRWFEDNLVIVVNKMLSLLLLSTHSHDPC